MSRPPRIKGFSYLGLYRYFATFCTVDRRDVFSDIVIGKSVVLQFRRTSRRRKFAILAYCVMPNHVHLLVEGTSGQSDFRRFMKTLKQGSGQAYSNRVSRAGPATRPVPSRRGPARVVGGPRNALWQEGYYDRVLRPDDDAKTIARYIVENPVRAGLVRSPLDYPLVGSDVWKLEEVIDSLI